MSPTYQTFKNTKIKIFIVKTVSVFQTLMNVTVPGPENCTSPSLCWVDGNYTFTLKNVSETCNIKKCKTD